MEWKIFSEPKEDVGEYVTYIITLNFEKFKKGYAYKFMTSL